MKTIKIEVYGGCVTEVTGLPDGWDYEIVDHDHKESKNFIYTTSMGEKNDSD